jgi:hypothetical protein
MFDVGRRDIAVDRAQFEKAGNGLDHGALTRTGDVGIQSVGELDYLQAVAAAV